MQKNALDENFHSQHHVKALFACTATAPERSGCALRIRCKERNAYSELDRLASSFNLPRMVRDRIASEYRNVLGKGIVRGNGNARPSVMAALTYAMCREYAMPRTLKEVARASGIEKRDVGRTYRYVSRALGLRVPNPKPEDYIPNFTSALGLEHALKAKAMNIISDVSRRGVVYERPSCAAAAAVYIASLFCGDYRSPNEIERATGISSQSVRNYSNRFSRKLGIENEIERKTRRCVAARQAEIGAAGKGERSCFCR